jgi:hypothetical protein
LQVNPHVTPLHVGCAFAGTGHGVHEAPHELTELLLSQLLPHWW